MLDKTHECNLCGKLFKLPANLKQHIKNVHDTKTNLYVCKTCEKTFDNLNYLKNHAKEVHSKEKLTCKLCEKMFHNSSILKKHIKYVHEGFKGKKCHLCHNYFASIKGLKAHLKYVHEGIKDFKCEFCEKMFHQSKDLITHIKTQHEIAQTSKIISETRQQITSQTKIDKIIKNITIKNVHEEPRDEKCLCTICHRFYRNAQVLEIHVTNVHQGIKE